MSLRHFIATALFLCGCATPAFAASVNLVGLIGNKALVSIDGGKPKMLAAGQRSAEGVMLVAIEGQQATFEIDGQTHRVAMGQHYSAPTESAGSKVVLTADTQGHFVTQGTINGAAITFLVDTGATSVAFSTGEAKRMGIDYHNAPRGHVGTANGTATAYRVKLDTVRIGPVTLNNVDGVVLESAMPVALLGMSFLNRMEMKRDGSTMTLTRRY